MRYHYEKPTLPKTTFGRTYYCDHPVYNRCTLFEIYDKGLAVIQQRFNVNTKRTWWTEIDPWLTSEIYLHPKFRKYFDDRAGNRSDDGLYPTVTVRQMMWALKIKPIKKERWETVFDRRDI